MNTLKALGLVAVSEVAFAASPAVPTASVPEETSVETRVALSLALRSPSCNDTHVSSLPSGRYVSQNTVIVYPSAAEASDPQTWSYEWRVMDQLLALEAQADFPTMDSAQYKEIDPKNTDRFIEPGSSFVLSDVHQLNARQATVNGRRVWLADSLPSACFGATEPEWEKPSAQKICFVPLTTDTAK